MTPKLIELSESQVAAFERDLSLVLRQLDKRVAGILTKLQTANGRLVKTSQNMSYIASLLPALEEALTESGYLNAITAFQMGDAQLLSELRKQSRIPMEFVRQDGATIAALQQMQFTQFVGIGNNAMESIRQSVMQSILTGARLEDSLSMIKDKLDSGLKRYAWTYANTTRRDVIQQANDLAAQNAGTEYWAYTGPLDDVTRDACQELLAIGYFTTAERNEAEAQYADERMYNCRHSFDPISAELYNEKK